MKIKNEHVWIGINLIKEMNVIELGISNSVRKVFEGIKVKDDNK